MKLSDILNTDLIKIPLQNNAKKEIIEEMIELAYKSGKIKDRNKVLKAVFDREDMMSTGIGNNVAIPHGKSNGVDQLSVALGVSDSDIDFDSLDGKPVRLVFLLLSPENSAGPHIKMLSRISRLLNQKNFRKKLISCKTPAETLEIIKEEEEEYFDL